MGPKMTGSVTCSCLFGSPERPVSLAVSLRVLELVNFRIFAAATFRPEPEGTTVITGPNGTGKTSVLEALVYLSTQRSFRGAPREALIRTDETRAIVRVELSHEAAPTLVEAEIVATGRSRTQVNRKTASASQGSGGGDPVHHLLARRPRHRERRAGGPAPTPRRRARPWSMHPEPGPPTRSKKCFASAPRLLRQAGGRVTADVAATLDVWDQRLAESAEILVDARERLVRDLDRHVGPAYGRLAGSEGRLVVTEKYQRSWEGDLLDALTAHRGDDIRRGVNTVGPHRDELILAIDGREARTHASQGEQRCLALALRIGVHRLVGEKTNLVPTLLLDDVFSELDPTRSQALVAELPGGQSILTTAVPLPDGIEVARIVAINEVTTTT